MDNRVLLIFTAISVLSIGRSALYPSTLQVAEYCAGYMQQCTDEALLIWSSTVDLVFSVVTVPLQVMVTVLRRCQLFLQVCLDGARNVIGMLLEVCTYLLSTAVNVVLEYGLYRLVAALLYFMETLVTIPFRLVFMGHYFRLLVDYAIHWPLKATNNQIQALVSGLLGGIQNILQMTLSLVYQILSVAVYIVVEVLCAPFVVVLGAFDFMCEGLKNTASSLSQAVLLVTRWLCYCLSFIFVTLLYSILMYILIRELCRILTFLLMLLHSSIMNAQVHYALVSVHGLYRKICSALYDANILLHNLGVQQSKDDSLSPGLEPTEWLDCAVCFEEVPLVRTLPCRHKTVCLTCLCQIQQLNGTCPMCRAPIHQMVNE